MPLLSRYTELATPLCSTKSGGIMLITGDELMKMDAQDTLLDDINEKQLIWLDMLREWIEFDCQKL
jgi:hypothetical protein